MQVHLLFREIRKQRHDRHEAETADLYQNQKNDLTEERPMGISVVNKKPRYTGCAGRSKKKASSGCVQTPSLEEKGNINSKDPTRITTRKLIAITRILLNRRFFIFNKGALPF